MNHSRKQLTVLALALGLTVLAGAGCGKGGGEQAGGGGVPGGPGATPAADQGTPVRVAKAVEKNVERTVPVTGSVAALQSIDLAPKITARVTQVIGREGTPVRRGQVVVQQDTSDLVTQVEQAQANLASARARLAQVQTQSRVLNTNSVGEVENTRQQLRQAEAALALAKKPQRTQEVAVAENAVRQAQANFERAQSDRQRYDQLVKEGAAAQILLDQYATQEKVSRAALDSARQQLDLARDGGRSENIGTAQANVVRARLGVGQARTNLQQIQARGSDVQAARAAVQLSQAALDFARLQVANASVRSPIDGVVSARLTEPGQLAAPGAAVLRIVSLKNVYFEAQVPETDVASIRAGLPAPVRVDAYPGKVFTGRVARVYPTASTTSRNFVVRVVLDNSGGRLRPGLFARGAIAVERRRGIVIPKDALLTRDGKTTVFVAQTGDTAKLRSVKVGVLTAETAEVRSGVRPGERVIVAGQEALEDGGKIRVQAGGDEGGTVASAR